MKRIGIILLLLMSFQACKESLKFDLDRDQIDTEEALSSPENLKALLNSCYDVLANVMDGDVQNLQELLGDQIAAPQNSAGSLYYTVYNRGTFSFRTADGVLLDLYRCIYRVNIFSENLDRFPEELDIKKLDAEAKFLRAFCHYELVKLWAQPYGFTADNSHDGVAIRLESHYDVKLRSSVAAVYEQIIKDLEQAATDLPETNNAYATSDAAKALLAKVYFTMNNFEKAAEYAGNVITSGRYQLSDTIQRFIADQGSENIFRTVSTGPSDNRGGSFIGSYRSDKNDNPPLKPSADVINLYDTADMRQVWIEVKDPGLPSQLVLCHKFDKDYFGVPLLHLADMYLIRAESILELNGDKQQAADDLNKIRERAYGKSDYNVTAATITLKDVRLERQKEMLYEGDRTTQLKRMGAKGEAIVIRGADWNCAGSVLQFPASEKTKGFEFNPEGGCN
ncbi:MAG: RagB/SusD family nutrient uptake outer membrane protein [Bacteroidetes bacterium]|nr:RagB/SusD family nutrient uptake outer membrane protein [Bacteroidota bacterium]